MSAGRKVAFDFIGCKLNQAEVEVLSRQFATAGYQVVAPSEEADVYILNTCTVTHVADRKSRHFLRLAHRRNPSARVVAIGCFAEAAPEALARLEGVDLVLGNEQKARLLDVLEENGYLEKGSVPASQEKYHGRWARSFLSIQEGCRNCCAYCIVPLVRGNEKSVPVEQVVSGVRQRVAEGYQEVVLTGTRIGAYRDGAADLACLLQRILAGTGVARLRLSSLQPPEISAALLQLWEDVRLCPHFHLSLQSGSVGVLQRMRRCYTREEYRQAVGSIRERVPGAAVTTDVIVGFPGETEAEFAESYAFCQQVAFARIHVFPYSMRQGTAAAELPGRINDRVKKEREQRMLALAAESRQRFMRQFEGVILPVLWEKRTDGVWSGLTGNYIRVFLKNEKTLENQLLPTKLLKVGEGGVWGELAD